MKISKVSWSQNDEIVLVLSKDLNRVPLVRLENTDIRVASVLRSDKLRYAKNSSYYVDRGKIHFLISPKSFPNVERDKNYYLCGDFNGWGDAINDEKWLLEPIYSEKNFWYKISLDLTDLNTKRAISEFKFASSEGVWLEPNRDVVNLAIDSNNHCNLKLDLRTTGSHVFVVKTVGRCQLEKPVRLRVVDIDQSADVDESVLLSKIYSHSKLGVSLEDGETVFRLFAPRAEGVYVIYRKPDEQNKYLLVANSRDSVIWTARADRDLNGYVYSFYVDGKNYNNTTAFNRDNPVADPYANAMLNSKGECIVKYDSDLPIADDSFRAPSWHDLVIVETHLRDVLANASVDLSSDSRLTFSGLAKWLASSDCYLRKCGANCVELQPIQEFTYENKTDYEWGYMPMGWFAPSSAYSLSPENASGNYEFAELVKAFHKAGLAVILDVVYNHYGEPNFLALVDKQYYFTTDSNGNLSNCSGCGNDFRSTTPMAKRMILDSLKKLMINYGVDGFRFDLAELVGFDVLVEIERELKRVKPSVILIAEPWSFRGHIAHKLKNTGFASWNDGFREFILQYVKGNGNFEGLRHFIKGSLGGMASFPAQSVNYVESHDDMCLFDRITGHHHSPSVEDLRRYKMAYAITLLSHGVPMLAEGFDLTRTKNGKNNTYKDGETNKLDYVRGLKFAGVCQWLRSLVKFRLSDEARALRRDGCTGDNFFKFYQVDGYAGACGVMFNYQGEDESCPSLFVAFNPSNECVELDIADDLENFVQIADIDNFNLSGLLSDSPIKNDKLLLPPLGMSLFKNA